mgnify:CR=1 FL=1
MDKRIPLVLALIALTLPLASSVEINLNTTINLTYGEWPSAVFHDGEFLYVAFEKPRQVHKYEINYEDGRLMRKKWFGSQDSDDEAYMGYPTGIWVDGSYLYVLASETIYKFDKETGRLRFRSESGSLKPKSGAGIAASHNGSTIYISDTSDNNIMAISEYDTHKYLFNSSIRYGGILPISGPQGIFYRDGLLFIADERNSRVAVVDMQSRSLISYYGRGNKDVEIPSPSHVSVDYEYAYVVHSSAREISLISRETSKLVLELNSSFYVFREIVGAHAEGDKLYVVDRKENALSIFDIDRLAGLSRDDVYEIYSKFNAGVIEACALQPIAESIGLNTRDECSALSPWLANATAMLEGEDYDALYAYLTDDAPNASEGALYVRSEVGKGLSSMLDSAVERVEYITGSTALPDEQAMLAASIIKDTQDAERMIAEGEFSSAATLLKECLVRVALLESMTGREFQGDMQVQYYSEHSALMDEYSVLAGESARFGMEVDGERIEGILAEVELEINSRNFHQARSLLDEVRLLMLEASAGVEERKAASAKANATISDAYASLDELEGSTFLFLSPDTLEARLLLSNATANVELNPSASLAYAEEAAGLISAERKGLDDAKFLLLFGIACAVFLLLVLALMSLGVIQLFRRH